MFVCFRIRNQQDLFRFVEEHEPHDELQDLQTMSDFDIHKTCETYRCIEHLALGNHLLCDSGTVPKLIQYTVALYHVSQMTTGKFQLLDDLLPQIRGKGDRVLIFSQVELNLV